MSMSIINAFYVFSVCCIVYELKFYCLCLFCVLSWFFLLYSIILILCVLSFIAIVIITVLSLCSAFGE